MNTVSSHLWTRSGSVVVIVMTASLAFRSATAQQVCGDATGNWTAGSNVVFGLVQLANGTVESGSPGGTTYPPSGSCVNGAAYFFTGTYSNGGFSIVGKSPTNYTPPGCAGTIWISGSIEKPGCDVVNITWFNDLSGAGTGTWVLFNPPDYIPTENSVATNRWVVPDPLPNPVDNAYTIPEFQQTLVNGEDGIFNWGGRTIKETFPDASGDSCHFVTSKYSYFIPKPALDFVMDIQDNNMYLDDVGADAEVINYYRYYQRAPCDFTTTQVMTISTSGADKGYATNPMDIHIDTATLTTTRANAKQNPYTWGTTQQQFEERKTTSVIIADWLLVHGL